MDARPDPDGLVTVASQHDVQATLDRLVAALKAGGATLFAVIDHAAGAKEAGLDLAPTTVVVFGDPRAGTALMQARQTVGIDLPLKILVWQGEAGAAQLSYNDPAWIARRHGLDPDALPNIGRMAAMLAALVSRVGQA